MNVRGLVFGGLFGGWMEHKLKIWPQYFCRVADGSKTFEVRKNDRGFQPGDTVCLREFDPGKKGYWVNNDPIGPETFHEEVIGYTGEKISFKVGYVLPIDAERVVFSLLPMDESNPR